MNKTIVKITNEIASNQGLDLDIMALYNAILDFNKEHKTITRPRCHRYEIETGLLYIDGAPVERVAPLPKKVFVDEIADYYEGRILARVGL